MAKFSNVVVGDSLNSSAGKLRVTHVFKNHFRTSDGTNWTFDGEIIPVKKSYVWIVEEKQYPFDAETVAFKSKTGARSYYDHLCKRHHNSCVSFKDCDNENEERTVFYDAEDESDESSVVMYRCELHA